MGKKAVVIMVSVILIGLFSMQSTCFAQNMLRKLGRGLANVVTGVVEIPKGVQETFYEEGPVAAASWGLIDGIYKFFARTLTGIYEVVTFPIPLPADYEPIVQPEFLFSPNE